MSTCDASELMYRYEDVMYAAAYDDTGRAPGTLKVELRTYEVVRRTDKGCWIRGCFLGANGMYAITGSERFVLLTARKRFACPTLDEARASFIARKRRQAGIYKSRMERALTAIAQLGPNSDEAQR
jgi:hypothetical protein